MGLMATASVGLALALDLSVEEFPDRVHPVALFGRVVALVDRSWRRPTLAGVAAALVLPLAAAALAGALTWAAGWVSPLLAAGVAGLALFASTSLTMLYSVAADVVRLSETDVGRARERVVALVGRDAAALSAAELRSAAVESAAENLADGLVAPLLAFAVGAQVSLAAGAAAAVWVKAVNTMDSMLGYPSKPVGRASARLDDLVMWLPARLSAVLLALAARSPGALVRARTWRGEPASPNSGWPMATLAAILDVRLAKPDAYVLNPAAELPSAGRAAEGVRIVGVAGLLLFTLAGVIVWS